MAKKRGLDMKLYIKGTGATPVLYVAALASNPASLTGYAEINTVNKVTKSFKSNETVIETRESADDYTLATSRVSEFTVILPVDLGDAFYGAFITASSAQTPIPLAFCVNALDQATNDIQAGNYSITEEDSDEPKKEGVLATFKCKPYSYYARVIDLTG